MPSSLRPRLRPRRGLETFARQLGAIAHAHDHLDRRAHLPRQEEGAGEVPEERDQLARRPVDLLEGQDEAALPLRGVAEELDELLEPAEVLLLPRQLRRRGAAPTGELREDAREGRAGSAGARGLRSDPGEKGADKFDLIRRRYHFHPEP